VVGHEAYEVSSSGQVRSLKHDPPRVLRGWIGSHGYREVGLDRVRWCVHVLVTTAFHGPRPSSGHVVRHKDGTRLNNEASNLHWGTVSDNLRDTVKHGNHFWANKTHCPERHAYTPENTYLYQGRRYCRACWTIRDARRRRKAKAS
jgi:hypothetical protein